MILRHHVLLIKYLIIQLANADAFKATFVIIKLRSVAQLEITKRSCHFPVHLRIHAGIEQMIDVLAWEMLTIFHRTATPARQMAFMIHPSTNASATMDTTEME